MYTPLFLPFHYFLYIADPLQCTPLTCPPMQASVIAHIWCTQHMMYNSHVYSSPFSYFMCPPMAQPITNHCTTQSGTYYTFTLDEPCAHFLVYHLYLTCLYLPFAPENCIYELPPVFRFSACASPHFTLIMLPHNPTIFTCYTMPGDDPLPPDCTLRAS